MRGGYRRRHVNAKATNDVVNEVRVLALQIYTAKHRLKSLMLDHDLSPDIVRRIVLKQGAYK